MVVANTPAARRALDEATRQAAQAAELAALPVQNLPAIEGIDEMHALTLVSELGTDFTKWPTVKHFTSWLGLCPNFKKTGGKVQSSRTRRGKGRAAHALRLAAWSLMRSHGALGA